MASDGWETVTFDGARRAQLRDQSRLDPAERLRWLEAALELAALAVGRPEGTRKGMDLDKALRLADALEDVEIVRKLERWK